MQLLEADNRHLKEENADLKEQLARVLRQQFGSKSERIEVGDLDIEIEEEPEPPATEPKAKPAANPEPKRKRRMKAHYRKVVEETRIPEEVMADPAAYVRLPESCDVIVERVESQPAILVLHRIRCPRFTKAVKRGKGKEDAPVCAAASATILPGSHIGASIVAIALHGKYALHLPLYRQIKEFERLGLEGLSEGVLCNWVRAAADALEPLWKTMHSLLLAGATLQVDETPIRCLKGDITKGTMWAMNNAEDNMCLYYWRTSRGKSVLDTLLREEMKEDGAVYGGAIVTDGYEAYASWLKDLPETARPAWQTCWAHVRRKFVEGARNSNDPDWCRKVVELIRPLYRIERELRESKAPPDEIAARRRCESREHVTAFFQALEERAKDTSNPPVNNLRKAIDYALSRRERLVTWLEHPDIPIDNNAVERAIRPLAVGRRNSLFIGSPEAGQRAAILYTMVRECQRVNVDGEAWLTEVLRRLPGYRGDYLDLLPGILPLSGTAAAGVAQI